MRHPICLPISYFGIFAHLRLVSCCDKACKYFKILFLFFAFCSVNAQVPDKMSFQAVIRDHNSNLVSNTVVGLRISIVKEVSPGTAVYSETHSVHSNENGLVSLVIGSGTSNDDFSAIEWGSDSFYTRLEMDITGGNNYSIIGTSQLLSVPYALFARTAEKLNDQNGQIGGGGDGSQRYIGEPYEGGIIFWLDHSKKHGLIVSMIDLNDQNTWSNVSNNLVGEKAANRIDGDANSKEIVNQGGHEMSSAKLCSDYTNADYGTGVFSNWYSPSIEELKKLSLNLLEVEMGLSTYDKKVVGSIGYNFYWSSTENDESTAWGINFYNRNPYVSNKFSLGAVRAVRKF